MSEGMREISAPPAIRPVAGSLCIVMVCADMSEADLVSRQLQELDKGCLVTYRRAEDLMCNAPTGTVALVIVATTDAPAVLARTLKWLRRRWPGCPITVVGDVGGGRHEMVAREGAAWYLTRPVSAEEWAAILSHALGEPAAQQIRSWLRR